MSAAGIGEWGLECARVLAGSPRASMAEVLIPAPSNNASEGPDYCLHYLDSDTMNSNVSEAPSKTAPGVGSSNSEPVHNLHREGPTARIRDVHIRPLLLASNMICYAGAVASAAVATPCSIQSGSASPSSLLITFVLPSSATACQRIPPSQLKQLSTDPSITCPPRPHLSQFRQAHCPLHQAAGAPLAAAPHGGSDARPPAPAAALRAPSAPPPPS